MFRDHPEPLADVVADLEGALEHVRGRILADYHERLAQLVQESKARAVMLDFERARRRLKVIRALVLVGIFLPVLVVAIVR